MRLMREDEYGDVYEPIRKGPWKRTERTTDAMLQQMAAKLRAGKSESQVADEFRTSRAIVQRARRTYLK